MFEPNLQILPAAQRELWKELQGVPVASLLNLAATKASVVQQRAEAKDYLDLDALISHGVSLAEALTAARAVYGDKFNAQLTLKALSFFGDGDLPSLTSAVQQRLRAAVRATDLDQLPEIPGPLSPIGP